MTLAPELERRGRSAPLLEGGAPEWSPESYENYGGDVVGDYYVGLEYAAPVNLEGPVAIGGVVCPLPELAFKKARV